MKTELKVKYLQHLNNKRREGGFTLIELLVVVIIIGILAAVALPSLLSQANKAKQVEARNNVGAMNRAQQSYYLENSNFATATIDDLGLGLADSPNYSYSVAASGTNAQQIAEINPADTGKSLKGYMGLAYTATQQVSGNTEAITLSILCEAANPGAQAAAPTAGTSTTAPATCGGSDKQLGT